jgi:hypothetical protein
MSSGAHTHLPPLVREPSLRLEHLGVSTLFCLSGHENTLEVLATGSIRKECARQSLYDALPYELVHERAS